MKFIKKTQIIIAFAGLLILASRMLSSFSPEYGFIAHTLLLSMFIILSLYRKHLQKVLLLLSAIPAASILVMTIPVPSVFQTIFFYGALFLMSVLYWYMFEEKSKIPVFAPTSTKGIMVAMITGQVLGIVSYALLPSIYRPYDMVKYGHMSVLLVVCTLIMFGVTEELYFRRLVQFEAEKHISQFNALALSAWLYASLAGSLDLPVTFLALVVGLMLAMLYSENKSTLQTIIVNVTMKLVFIAAVFIM